MAKFTKLQYDDYKQYEVDPTTIGFTGPMSEDDVDIKFVFPNGYGASVIKHFRILWV